MQNGTTNAAQDVSRGAKLAHYGRMLVCVLTAGFAFPNVFIEDMKPRRGTLLPEFEVAKKEPAAAA